jgi:hypothetical protein
MAFMLGIGWAELVCLATLPLIGLVAFMFWLFGSSSKKE